uniref:Uncharacterized protein n=1 Tax=Caenorhabditis japonica TaxID=281687 RepID=A0A8R1IDW3_CAEJA
MIYAFSAVYQLVMMKFFFLNTLIITIFSIVFLESIFFRNRNKLSSLNRHNKVMQYTLSVRYQLQENVHTCKVGQRANCLKLGRAIIFSRDFWQQYGQNDGHEVPRAANGPHKSFTYPILPAHNIPDLQKRTDSGPDGRHANGRVSASVHRAL